MKFRTFLTTLALFLVSFNLGILLISVTTYKDTVHRAEEKSLGEHYFITSALIKDLHAVESRGMEPEDALGAILQPYGYLSGDKTVKLALYKGNQLLYSNGLSMSLPSRSLEPPADGNRLVSMQKSDGRTYIWVSGMLPAPYRSYTLIYLYDTTDAIAAWTQSKNMLFVAGAILSGLFALGLLLVLNRIFKPLSQISQTSRYIAAGAYETRLPVSGRDELSEMAQSFNHMAAEVQRQMTELIRVADKKQQFIDNFAHELRTPLTAIYGYADYMQKAAMSEDDRLSAIGYILSESRRLTALADHLLDLANLRNDQITLEAQQVARLYQAVQQTLQAKLADKRIQLEFVDEIHEIWGDAYLLESLFINLIDNAIKACDPGGRIKVHAAMEAGKRTIRIQDNGQGMTAEVLGQITEPFYRAEKSRNRREGGAGLGLAICKQIVLRHGAELVFRSRPGEGTTAIVTFTTPS